MKRTFALLLTALLTLSMTACGSYNSGSTTNRTPDNSVNDNGVLGGGTSSKTATGTSVTKNVSGNRVDNGAPGTNANAADNSMLGLENDGVGAPKSAVLKNGANTTTATTTTTTQNGTTGSVIRGTTYGQMLRNARVHDRDGFLLDGENAVTPGAAYR